MTQIQQIESEIQALKAEITKLKELEANLTQNLPAVVSANSADELLAAAKDGRMATAERQGKLADIKMAIATLEQQLAPKIEVFQNLRMEQNLQAKRERVQTGRVKIQAVAQKVNDLSVQLESAFQELKQLHKEFNSDYRSSQQNPGIGAGWSHQDLIKFGKLALPSVANQGDSFVVESRFIDLFKPEKDAVFLERAMISVNKHRSREQEMLKLQQQEADAKRRFEMEQLKQEISAKNIHIRTIERQKEEAISSGAKLEGGAGFQLDPGLDRRIGFLKGEIHDLEMKLYQLEESK
ncbi:MAG TPA: hypothetical protein V6D09_05030 [Leptolyngbyaceae cyanobacterium]